MIQIKFRDINPDTGGISQEKKLAETDSVHSANLIVHVLNYMCDEPNREHFKVDPDDPDRELSYDERIAWFVANYYETGMEYSALLDTMRTENLDKFEWIGETVKIPRLASELGNSSI